METLDDDELSVDGDDGLETLDDDELSLEGEDTDEDDELSLEGLDDDEEELSVDKDVSEDWLDGSTAVDDDDSLLV